MIIKFENIDLELTLEDFEIYFTNYYSGQKIQIFFRRFFFYLNFVSEEETVYR